MADTTESGPGDAKVGLVASTLADYVEPRPGVLLSDAAAAVLNALEAGTEPDTLLGVPPARPNCPEELRG